MRMFFHLNECGKLTRDLEGQDLPNLEAGRAAAVRAAREVMCAEILEGRLCLSCSIEITDGDGNAITTVPFSDVVEITR